MKKSLSQFKIGNIFLKMIVLTFIFVQGCGSCSQSGLKNAQLNKSLNKEYRSNFDNKEKTIVKMEKVNGVFQIPVVVNDINMFFIFDTGASFISISETEAYFLYKQGKLSNEDILGTANFSDANGDISEGTIIILSTVKIGDKILSDVQASVVHNLNAPLLLGQTALEKFGKVSIDYYKNEITFE